MQQLEHATPASPRPDETPGHRGREGRWGGITLRSVVLGTLASAGVCALAPFNDYVVANTLLVGSYFPIALALLLFVLVVLVNGPLHRLRPAWALTAPELAVIMAMMLAGCSVASQGLMRNWLPTLVAPFHIAQTNPEFRSALAALNLPQWLFPATAGDDAIVQGFLNRLPPEAPVPLGAWVVPLLGWGIFFGGLFATLIALTAILGPQWAVNERLSFPLAQVQLALIEPPERGRALNRLLGSRPFWIAAAAVFVMQSSVALQRYFPEYVPAVPLGFDLRGVFANEPWLYLSWPVKVATIYFTLIGLSYFIPTRVSFSLWAIYLFTELVNLQQRSMHAEISTDAWQDQHLGATIALVGGTLYIGRHRLMEVLRCFGRRNTVNDRDVPPVSRWSTALLLAGPAVMVGWLAMLGVQVWVALLIVVTVLAAHLVVARIVAETGLPFTRSYAAPLQVVTELPVRALGGADVFFAGVCTTNASMTTRESLLTYAMHGQLVRDSATGRRGSAGALLALIAWALVVGIAAGAVSSLHCYYRYAMPLAEDARPPLNNMATEVWPQTLVADPLIQHASGRFSPQTHRTALHVGIGLCVTIALQVATLRWAAWPLLPVGYLTSTTWHMQVAWFSILLGWLAKTLIVRFGGVKLYQQARPFFFGMVFGEAMAVAFWMLVSLVLALSGEDYHVVNFLPT